MPQIKPLPLTVTNITDDDFWGALCPLPHHPQSQLLNQALTAGRAGTDDAWLALAAYHRHALAAEWVRIEANSTATPPPDPERLQKLYAHEITIWHTQVIQFAAKIDWWPAAAPFDCQSGFHYMHWLWPALTAFIQTGDAQAGRFLNDILQQYTIDQIQHPLWRRVIATWALCPLGVNGKWELFLAAYLALINKGQIEPRTIAGMAKMFLMFGNALAFHLRDFVPGNNGFAVGVRCWLHLVRAFPEFKRSAAWDKKAVSHVAQMARVGFYADGGNRERVWGYGIMHLQALADSYLVAQRYGGLGQHEALVRQTVRRVCQWYAKSVTPTQAFPTYGDAGWGSYDAMQSIKRIVKPIEDATKAIAAVDPSKSYLLKPSGFAIMRSGGGTDASYVNLSFGEFAGWHSHWDLLSLNFWSHGAPLLEELCRFGPYCNPLDTLFRAPESHNLVTIDGMIYDSREVVGENVAWFSNEHVTYFSATHRAYRYFVFGRGGTPVSPNIEALIRRTVLLVHDPGYVLVLDAVSDVNSTDFNGAITQHWHAPHPFKAVAPGLARTGDKQSCLLAWTQAETLHRLDTAVDFAGQELADYNPTHERYALRARRWQPLGHHGINGFTTLLYPFTGKMPAVTLRELPLDNKSQWRVEGVVVETARGADTIVLNPERLTAVACAGVPIKGRGMVKLAGRRNGDWNGLIV